MVEFWFLTFRFGWFGHGREARERARGRLSRRENEKKEKKHSKKKKSFFFFLSPSCCIFTTLASEMPLIRQSSFLVAWARASMVLMPPSLRRLRSAAAMPSSCFFLFLRERLSVFLFSRLSERARAKRGKNRLNSRSMPPSAHPRLDGHRRESARARAWSLFPRRGRGEIKRRLSRRRKKPR